MVIALVAILFSVLSTAIMAYIAMATSAGPWIDPTLVFLGIIIFRFLLQRKHANHAIGFATVSGALGGIIAVACGWAFPTLYFLDPTLFHTWISDPVYFCTLLTATVLVAGGLGFIIVHICEQQVQALAFPIGEMSYKMIYVHNQVKKTIELLVGVVSVSLLSLISHLTTWIPEKITLMRTWSYGVFMLPSIAIRFDLFPVFISIGFIAGKMFTMPLIAGLVARLAFVEPLQRLYFSFLSADAFSLAFVSGIVLQGAFFSLLEIPSQLKALRNHTRSFTMTQGISYLRALVPLIPLFGMFLFYFKFSVLAQLYLIVCTVLATFQVIGIAGRTGLAPFPRFATFILIPGMLLFSFDAVQITILSTFVEVCCGVAVSLLFGRKLAQLAAMSRTKTVWYQLLGLLVSALSIGIIFYVLISRFGLGSPELLANRAQLRALLVLNQHFDYTVLCMGIVFGFLLRAVRLNYLLVMSAFLMPIDLSLSLVLGGLLSYAVRDPETLTPFWSGVFAAGSLWMVVQAFW